MPVLDFLSLHIDDDAAATLPTVVLAQLMGEVNPDNLSATAADWLVTRDLLYTISVMCDPDHLQNPDDALVGRLHDALNANEISDVSEILSEVEGLTDVADVDVVLKGASNPRLAALVAASTREDPINLMKGLLSTDWLAHIAAGYILRWIVSRWRDPLARNEASLTQAVKTIEQWCKSNGIKGGGEQNIKRNMWTKYKPVSHLWAAFYIMKDVGIDIGTPDGFQTFLSTAQWLLETASNIVPKGRRAGEAILSREHAWQVPASYVRRAVLRATGEDLGIVAVWSNELDAHDIRRTGRRPLMNNQV